LSALRVSIRSAISSIVYIRYRLGAAHVHCAQPVGHGTASFIFLFEIGPDLGPIIAGKNAAHEIGPDLATEGIQPELDYSQGSRGVLFHVECRSAS